MKTIFKSAAVLFGMALLSTGTFAATKMQKDTVENDVSASVTYFENTAGVDVNIDNATACEAVVTLSDADGNVVLTDKFTTEKGDVKKSYLVDKLAEGEYTISVSTNDEVTATTLTLSSEDSEETFYEF